MSTYEELALVYDRQAARLEEMAAEIRAFNEGDVGAVDMLPVSSSRVSR